MMANAVITSQTTRVKVVYNDASDWFVEDYFYRDQVTRISRTKNQQGVEIIRIHLSDGEYIDGHFSTVDSIQALADPSPVAVTDNATLLAKLIEIKDE